MAGKHPDRELGKTSAETLMRWELLRILAGARDKAESSPDPEPDSSTQLPPGFEDLNITGPLNAETIASVDAALHALASEELRTQEPSLQVAKDSAEPPRNGLRSLMLPQAVAQLQRDDPQYDQSTESGDPDLPYVEPGRLRRTASAPSTKRRYRVSIGGPLPSIPDRHVAPARASNQLQVPGTDGRGAHRRTVSDGPMEQTLTRSQDPTATRSYEAPSTTGASQQTETHIPQAQSAGGPPGGSPSQRGASDPVSAGIQGQALARPSSQQPAIMPGMQQRIQSPPSTQTTMQAQAIPNAARPPLNSSPGPARSSAPLGQAQQPRRIPQGPSQPGVPAPGAGGRPGPTGTQLTGPVPPRHQPDQNIQSTGLKGGASGAPQGQQQRQQQRPGTTQQRASRAPFAQSAQHAPSTQNRGVPPNRAPSARPSQSQLPPAQPSQSSGRSLAAVLPGNGQLPTGHPAPPVAVATPGRTPAVPSSGPHPDTVGRAASGQAPPNAYRPHAAASAVRPGNVNQPKAQTVAQRPAASASPLSNGGPIPSKQGPLLAPAPQRSFGAAGPPGPAPSPAQALGTPPTDSNMNGPPIANASRSATPRPSPMGRQPNAASPMSRPASATAAPRPMPDSPSRQPPANVEQPQAGNRPLTQQLPSAGSQSQMGRQPPASGAAGGRPQTPQAPTPQQATRPQTPVQSQLGGPPRPNTVASRPQTPSNPSNQQAMRPQTPNPPQFSQTPQRRNGAPTNTQTAGIVPPRSGASATGPRTPIQSPSWTPSGSNVASAQSTQPGAMQSPPPMPNAQMSQTPANGGPSAEQQGAAMSGDAMQSARIQAGVRSPPAVNAQKGPNGAISDLSPGANAMTGAQPTSQAPEQNGEAAVPPFMQRILSGQGAVLGSGPSHGMDLVEGDYMSGEMFDLLMSGRLPRDMASEQNSWSALQLTAQGLLYTAQGFLGPQGRQLTISMAESLGII